MTCQEEKWDTILKYLAFPQVARLDMGHADVSADRKVKTMDESVRWVTKAEAAEELGISLSTLDRKIRKGEVEVAREGRRVYVRMEGPEYLNDEELLRRALDWEEELERTVGELEVSVSELKLKASELERDRDEARESASAARRPYEELQRAYRKEVDDHRETREALIAVQVTALVLLALLIGSVLLWWFVLR